MWNGELAAHANDYSQKTSTLSTITDLLALPPGLQNRLWRMSQGPGTSITTVNPWTPEQECCNCTHPQCFMFCGLSMRTASLIFRSWSGQAFVRVILWSSACLGLFGVGCRTTCLFTTQISQLVIPRGSVSQTHKATCFFTTQISWLLTPRGSISQTHKATISSRHSIRKWKEGSVTQQWAPWEPNGEGNYWRWSCWWTRTIMQGLI